MAIKVQTFLLITYKQEKAKLHLKELEDFSNEHQWWSLADEEVQELKELLAHYHKIEEIVNNVVKKIRKEEITDQEIWKILRPFDGPEEKIHTERKRTLLLKYKTSE